MKYREEIKQIVFTRQAFFFIALCFLAFYFRFYLIPENLFFGPEQGRDILAVKKIAVEHNLTLIGARTEVEGLFYGPFYYYLMAIPFVLGDGNPIVLSAFLIILHAFGVFLIYLLGKELFNKRVGFIAAVLYTVSFGTIVAGRWLSHPPLAILLSTLFFYFLSRFLRGEKKNIFFAAIVFGLIGQTQIYSYPFLGSVLFFLIIFYRKQFSKHLFSSLISLLIAGVIAVGNIIIFDIKHDFLISKSIGNFMTQKTGFYRSFLHTFTDTFVTFSEVFAQTIFPLHVGIAIILAVISGLILFISKKSIGKSILLLWLSVPMILFILLRHDVLDHYFMSLIPAMILLTAQMISKLWEMKRIGILLFGILIAINISVWQKNISTNTNISFQSTQPNFRYTDQIKTVETIYAWAGNEKFYYQPYTIPYWLGQAWDYLFWYYGKQHGKNTLFDKKAKKLYVIIQKDTGNKLFQEVWLRDIVNKWGERKREVTYGDITLVEMAVR